MERKTPNLCSWKRVIRHRFVVERVENLHFRGYVTRFHIDKVSEPRIKHQGNRTWCLADEGFLWVQYFPEGRHYTIRTILDASGNVVQWYIDICSPYFLDNQGVPTYDDWDLDVVVWPDGEIELWDADELEQSLQDGLIAQEEYEVAWCEARRLMDDIRVGRLVLPSSEDEVPRWV